jgi:hypothetical protein
VTYWVLYSIIFIFGAEAGRSQELFDAVKAGRVAEVTKALDEGAYANFFFVVITV